MLSIFIIWHIAIAHHKKQFDFPIERHVQHFELEVSMTRLAVVFDDMASVGRWHKLQMLARAPVMKGEPCGIYWRGWRIFRHQSRALTRQVHRNRRLGRNSCRRDLWL